MNQQPIQQETFKIKLTVFSVSIPIQSQTNRFLDNLIQGIKQFYLNN